MIMVGRAEQVCMCNIFFIANDNIGFGRIQMLFMQNWVHSNLSIEKLVLFIRIPKLFGIFLTFSFLMLLGPHYYEVKSYCHKTVQFNINSILFSIKNTSGEISNARILYCRQNKVCQVDYSLVI